MNFTQEMFSFDVEFTRSDDEFGFTKLYNRKTTIVRKDRRKTRVSR